MIQRFGSALNLNVHLHGAHACAPPLGRPTVVQIGNPADLSHAVPRRGVCRASRWLAGFPLGQGADRLRVGPTDPNTGTAHWPPPRTPWVAGARRGDYLPGWR
ncbi:MAG: hypothetical protein KDK06_09055 [Gammaproteobacteria bacterium]|nr:hypothetical protein [Gammaproteobacteria bacterium]